MGEPGRPAFTDDDYYMWLEDMKPFLKQGNSLYYCACKAGQESHYGVILQKYKSGDWFSKKVDAYRAYPGELINDSLTRLIDGINEKIKKDMPLTEQETKILTFMAEKHRTSQPFFVSRTESAQADENKIGKVLDTIEASNYDTVRQKANEQMVAANEPVQD
jgi:hypothetical protein